MVSQMRKRKDGGTNDTPEYREPAPPQQTMVEEGRRSGWLSVLLKILGGLAVCMAATSAVLLLKFDVHRTEHLKLPEQLQPFRPV